MDCVADNVGGALLASGHTERDLVSDKDTPSTRISQIRRPELDADEKPNRRAASWQAQVAFYVSLCTAAFTVFQSWNADREATRTAAVDLSLKYLADTGIDAGKRSLEYLPVEHQNTPGQIQQLDSAAKFIRTVEYIAYLINNGKLAREYVAPAIYCDFLLATRLADANRIMSNVDRTEIARAVGPNEEGCK